MVDIIFLRSIEHMYTSLEIAMAFKDHFWLNTQYKHTITVEPNVWNFSFLMELDLN